MELPQGYSNVGGAEVAYRWPATAHSYRSRCFAVKPTIDEATSALDYLTERQVYLNLKKAFEGSTVFFITHRLSTIRSADRILMMDSGAL